MLPCPDNADRQPVVAGDFQYFLGADTTRLHGFVMRLGWYRTRGGELAWVGAVSPPEINTGIWFVGIIERQNQDGTMEPHSWSPDGRSSAGSYDRPESLSDLVELLPDSTSWGHFDA
jgi:hypothetical protein